MILQSYQTSTIEVDVRIFPASKSESLSQVLEVPRKLIWSVMWYWVHLCSFVVHLVSPNTKNSVALPLPAQGLIWCPVIFEAIFRKFTCYGQVSHYTFPKIDTGCCVADNCFSLWEVTAEIGPIVVNDIYIYIYSCCLLPFPIAKTTLTQHY